MTWWPGPRVPYVPVADDPCPVCELVRDRSGEPVVFRDRSALAYLSRPAAVPGHVVVAPLEHAGAVIDLAAPTYTSIHKLVYDVCTALAAVVPTARLLQVSAGEGHLRWEVVPVPPGAPAGLTPLDLATLGAIDLPGDQEASLAAALRSRLDP